MIRYIAALVQLAYKLGGKSWSALASTTTKVTGTAIAVVPTASEVTLATRAITTHVGSSSGKLMSFLSMVGKATGGYVLVDQAGKLINHMLEPDVAKALTEYTAMLAERMDVETGDGDGSTYGKIPVEDVKNVVEVQLHQFGLVEAICNTLSLSPTRAKAFVEAIHLVEMDSFEMYSLLRG